MLVSEVLLWIQVVKELRNLLGTKKPLDAKGRKDKAKKLLEVIKKRRKKDEEKGNFTEYSPTA